MNPNSVDASDATVSTGLPLLRSWQRKLQRFFQLTVVEAGVGVLIVVSVVLTVFELATGQGDVQLGLANDIITVVFAIELTLRALASRNKRRFLREYWLDILAVLPLFRIFRVMRALRLLRLLRMLRVLGLLQRYVSHFPDVMRRGAVEYVIISGIILLTVVFGTAAILAFERGPESELNSFGQAFWWSLYTLVSGEPVPTLPQTLGGRIVAIIVMFFGLGIFAMFTGTVSAFMVDRLARLEASSVVYEELENHAIICGWNRKAEIVVRELQQTRGSEDFPIVVIGEFDTTPEFSDPVTRREGVCFISDDFTKVPVLTKAGVERAETCIILSDTTGGRTEQDADARTILAALTVERLNPNVYTCAELNNRVYGPHLEMGKVNDFVISGEYSSFLLAQAAVNRGLVGVVSELLTSQYGNQFYKVLVPARLIGQSSYELFCELKKEKDAILVAVQESNGEYHVNPKGYVFSEGDQVIVISRELIDL